MSGLEFLPSWPLPVSALVLFGALLLAGVVGGEVARRIRLPAITGYILVGMLLGQTGLGFLTPELIAQSRVFVDISLGLILFGLGRRLDFRWLRRDRWLAISSVSESFLSFLFIYITLRYFDLPPLFAAVAAAIGIASSPAVVMLISQELRSEGQVTERALNLVALNSVTAFVAVTMLLSALNFEYRTDWTSIVLHPLYLLAGSATLGTGAWIAALVLGRWLGKHKERQFVLIVALIIATVGAAGVLNVSVLLTLLIFGILVKNRDPGHYLLTIEIGARGQLFFVVLFVVTGAALDAKYLVTGGGIAVAYIAARVLGKTVGVLPWALLSGLTLKNSTLLAATLTPMAGFAVVIVQDVWALYPEFYQQALAVVISAVVMFEVVGPIAAHLALKYSGEAHSVDEQR